MINPLSVLIAIPAYDGKVETGTCGGVMACAAEHLFGNIVFLDGCAGVDLARNLIVHGFLQSSFEWLVFVDADILFTSKDFKLLMNYPIINGQPPDNFNDDATMGITSNVDKDAIACGLEPLISCAEYARKLDTAQPARFGLGFCKIHRSVFTKLSELNAVDGSANLDQFMYQGKLVTNYFLSGCFNHTWMGEDTGFFHLVRMAGITPRIEQRTKLIHVGKKQFPYHGPVIAAN